MAFMAPVLPLLPYISAGMTVLGGVMGANAQAQQGEAAYQNALLRNQQMQQQASLYQMQAEQQRKQAGQEQAIAQRRAIEAQRKGGIMASRARAVMAASGGGVDEKLIDSLVGEGFYGRDVELAQGDERARVLNNQAMMTEYQGAGARWSGETAVGRAAADRSAFKDRAWGTILGSVASAGLGLAGKYAPDFGGGGAGTFQPVAGNIADTDAYKSFPGVRAGFDADWNAVV